MTEILDQNRIPVIQGVSKTDGVTLVPVMANPLTHTLLTIAGGAGVASSGNSPRDEDRKIAFMGVSSVDGITPVAVYVDPVTNSLLISQ